MPRGPLPGSVRASTTAVSATLPFVMKALVPFEDEGVAFRGGGRPHRGGVGAGAGLGQAPRPQHLAPCERRDVPLALRRGAERVEVVGAERVVGPHRDADGAVDTGELLHDERVGDVVEARAAVAPGGRARP